MLYSPRDGGFGRLADGVDGRFHAHRAHVGGVGDVDGLGLELVVGHVTDGADLFEILVGENGLTHFEALLLGGACQVEDVGARADEARRGYITDSSRIGSIGGFVTWAKFCLK